MKKILIAAFASTTIYVGPAIAADMPAREPVRKSIAQLYSWTGWYAGYNAGVGASQITAATPTETEGFNGVAGVGLTGGVQAGYNWHIGPNLVAGIEGDAGILRINRSVVDWNDNEAFGVRTDAFATLRGRLGYTNGPSLFYVTAGVSALHIKNTFEERVSSDLGSNSRFTFGSVAGAGLETTLGGNWTAKLEYLHIDAGDVSVDGSSFGRGTADFENRFHVFRYGVNYRFGGAAMSAAALPAHNWSGPYAGVNAGVGVVQDAIDAPPNVNIGSSMDIAASGFVGGAQAGYNWLAFGNWVAGIEADIGVLDIGRSLVNWNDSGRQFGVDADWYGTLRGRFGHSTGSALLYLTGGAAFVNVKNNLDDSSGAVARSETAVGWTAGGGIEAVVAHNWTAKTEYLYVDAGNQKVANSNILSSDAVATHRNRFHAFRFGLNYKFGG